jgi:hypothetical protein
VDARRRGVEGFEGAPGALEEERPRPESSPRACPRARAGAGKGLFELAHVQADRGLAQVKELGSPREALEPRDLMQGAQVDGIDGHNYQNFS